MLVISIIEAKYLDGYRIQFEFSDHSFKTIDFGPFLNHAKNPMTRKFLDLTHFRNFRLENGEINWYEYELCFPIWDLYEGVIEKYQLATV